MASFSATTVTFPAGFAHYNVTVTVAYLRDTIYSELAPDSHVQAAPSLFLATYLDGKPHRIEEFKGDILLNYDVNSQAAMNRMALINQGEAPMSAVQCATFQYQ